MFAKLLDDLISSGMTENQIASAIGRSQATVNRWRNQKHALDLLDAADKLRALHREKLPEQYTERRTGKAAA